MHQILIYKRSWVRAVGFVVALCMMLIAGNNQFNSDAQVVILATPSHGAAAPFIIVGEPNFLKITGNPDIEKHFGREIAVYDSRNSISTGFFADRCSGTSFDRLPDPVAPGKKWILKADTDGDGDFNDVGGSAKVTYSISDTDATPDSLTLVFGLGIDVTPIVNGQVTISPPPSSPVYAWVDVSIPGATADHTDIPTTLGEYTFASCGIEGPILSQNFLGTTTFTVKANTTTVTLSSRTGTVAPGTSVTDSANVTAQLAKPRPQLNGTVSFFLCGPTVSATPCTAGGTPSGTIPVPTPNAGSATVASLPQAPITQGFYCWRAEYDPPATDLYTKSNSTVITNECFRVLQQPGTIIIKKNTIPNDTTLFNFTPTGFGSGKFQLEDDGDEGDGKRSVKSFGSITPGGAYSVLEGKDSKYKQTADCDDDASSTPSVVIGRSIEINVDPGETVTCTFKNEKTTLPPEPPILCGDGTVATTQPEDAISMTSIRNGNIVKTIHAEKQIFNCELPQGDIPVIADVTIIAEIYENIDTKTILSKQAVAITCIKEPDRVRMLECDMSTPSTDRIPVTNCIESSIQHPQEMNSIQKGNTAKTVETQKEVFECTMNTPQDPTDDKKVDLLLFTELFQNLNMQTTQDPQIMSMKCVIKIDTVTVEACRFANHPV